MSKKTDFPFTNELGDMFGSLKTLTQGETINLVPKKVTKNLDDYIDEHIFGLLSQDQLSSTQILLLAALLQGRK